MLSSECLSVKFCALKYIILAIFNERDGNNSYLFPTGKVSRLLPELWQSQATHLVRSQGQDTGHSVSFSSFFFTAQEVNTLKLTPENLRFAANYTATARREVLQVTYYTSFNKSTRFSTKCPQHR